MADTRDMTGAIGNLAGSLAGTQPAASNAVRETRRKDEEQMRRRGIRDAYEPVVVEVEHADAVRDLKDNSQEETREDRQEQASYGRDGRPSRGERGANLDLRG